MSGAETDEHVRLRQSPGDGDPWRLWGPYVSGRQWGTVREDYSANGDAWNYFPFEQAHARAYRWGEDGIAGITDRFGFLNLAVALWNGRDDRLKERLFGLTNEQGNHGEDAKEYWWALDATPTHSWARSLYRYPQTAFPYAALRAENARLGRTDSEYQLADTGVLEGNRFFDVVTTHAKAAPDDLCVVLEATNHGPDPAPLDLIPQLWFRNTWAWGRDDRTPLLRLLPSEEVVAADTVVIEATHAWLGRYVLAAQGAPEVLVCDNETHVEAVFGPGTGPSRSPYPKDAVNRAIVHGDRSGLNPAGRGTKVALRYHFDAVAPGETVRVRLRLHGDTQLELPFGHGFDAVLADRAREADEFYDAVIPARTDEVDRLTARRAFAGLMWGKQLYRYSVKEWLEGDPSQPTPPVSRLLPEPAGRNTGWRQFSLADVISMPDEWEYPWFASWDLAFHCVAIAHIDPAFAKNQLLLMCREWAQNPNGQLPAYEWSFSDVNPPVHAWAAWQVYVLDGSKDHAFLVRIFTKLMFNFGWWLNRKDSDGSNLFEGGFLGMDNISLFDRSREVPAGWRLEQSDATSWMAFMSLSMLRIALRLSRKDPAWDGLATTFLEHFFSIAQAMETFGTDGVSLWDESDGFFYDVLVDGRGRSEPVRVRSLVGLLPLIAVAHVPAWAFRELSDVTARVRWLQRRRPELTDSLLHSGTGMGAMTTLTPLSPDRVDALLRRLFDEGEFLGPYGVRSLSAAYRGGATIDVGGTAMSIAYDPGESSTGLFGGNSNWRGPVWFPINVLLADGLLSYAAGVGSALTVEFPTGSGSRIPLDEAAGRIHDRLIALFRPGPDGRRPGTPRDHPTGPLWDAHPTFAEYFDGDTGRGCGASHQTGWTALVAHLICTRP
ncbi:MAG TPA: glucosidase [Phycicoccus sp.]|nr:glucosidase [Phycicoccus sp.]